MTCARGANASPEGRRPRAEWSSLAADLDSAVPELVRREYESRWMTLPFLSRTTRVTVTSIPFAGYSVCSRSPGLSVETYTVLRRRLADVAHLRLADADRPPVVGAPDLEPDVAGAATAAELDASDEDRGLHVVRERQSSARLDTVASRPEGIAIDVVAVVVAGADREPGTERGVEQRRRRASTSRRPSPRSGPCGRRR